MKDHTMRKAMFFALLSGAALTAHAAGFSQNFDKNFKPGPLAGNGRYSDGLYVVQAADPGTISITGEGASAPNALKVERVGTVGTVSLRSSGSIPHNTNFRAGFKVKVETGNSCCMWVGAVGKNKPVGGIVIRGGESPKAYNDKMQWEFCGMQVIPADEWVAVELVFDAQKRTYRVAVTGPDGKRDVSPIELPMLAADAVNEVRFINGLPQGNFALIDDVVLKPVSAKAAESAVPTSKVVFSQRFDKGFQPGDLAGNGAIDGGAYTVQSADPGTFSIVGEGVSAPNALRVERVNAAGTIVLRMASPLPASAGFRAAFKAKVENGKSCCMWVGAAGKSKPAGGVVIRGGASPKAYNDKMVWSDSGMAAIPADEWVTVELLFDVQKKTYRVAVTGADGAREVSAAEFPMLSPDPVNELRFINSLPKGNAALVDDVEISIR